MSRAKPKFKYKAVQSPQAPEDKGLPVAKSGLFRFLGAYLNVKSELDALSLVRYEQSHAARIRAVNTCPVMSWANQSIGTLKHCSLSNTVRILIRICRQEINFFPSKSYKCDL